MDLGGSAENQGDLKSVVLHKMTLAAHKSTFPIALGVRMTGVDDSCFSQTGESYSMIAMPNADSHNARTLQEDNTELAYECKLLRLKPHHTNHASPCAPCSVGSRAQVPGLHCREYALPLNHTRVHTRAHTPPSLCTDLDTKGIHEARRCAFRRTPPTPADARLLAHRSPPAASALLPLTIP